MAKKKGKGKATNKKTKCNLLDLNTQDILDATLREANQPILLKACRLCMTKEGPFLNIFSSERILAKKIDDLLPFVIKESDDLPHKICFRCSAKVEELYDFVQKCVKSQENFCTTIGRKDCYNPKSNFRKIWEKKLNKSNMSNDDICDAIVKKAMEGIKDLQPLPPENTTTEIKNTKKLVKPHNPNLNEQEKNDNIDLPESLKQGEIIFEKTDKNTLLKAMLTCDQKPLRKEYLNKPDNTKIREEDQGMIKGDIREENNSSEEGNKETTTREFKLDEIATQNENKPAFNIMSYVSTIKVNGVGTLFQCKLCNRNFLKRDVVLTHACAKNGVPKVDFTKSIPISEPPRNPISNVKYITRAIPEVSKAVKTIVDAPVLKPKVGPASKTGRVRETHDVSTKEPPKEQNANAVTASTVSVSIPNMKSQYKLVPGPNNTFTLVEDPRSTPEAKSKEAVNTDKDKDSTCNNQPIPNFTPNDQPYPVGLFQTIPRNIRPPSPPKIPTATMRKQSYTVVQTGNPSKLLISAKPQAAPVPEETGENKGKKGKKRKQTQTAKNEVKQPFQVTLEDAAPPKDASDGFFTFINVDPLLQPSYVLPTNNIIQESQITTSSSIASGSKNSRDLYMCNLCNTEFSREKKLHAHIQSHYNKMDEDDFDIPPVKNMRKRSKKS